MAQAKLSDVVEFVDRTSRRLDPDSRYVRELKELVAASKSVKDLEARLNAGCRGLRHAGADVFARMSLDDKLLSNLITAETTLFRFSEGELEAIDQLLLPNLAGRIARALIVPCSHGEEAFTLAAYLTKVGIRFSIDAFDVQPELIAEASTGRLTFGYPVELLAQAGFVSGQVLRRIRFRVGDAFALPLSKDEEPFDIVLSRNFLGYFVEAEALRLVEALAARVAHHGVLFLDAFCLSKTPAIAERLAELGGQRLAGRPVFRFLRS